ncbi:mannosyltransferase putative-domain-containing protein [Mycena crocata]|nr:mannosyltransferase putative-domain-containing protein [Mycena crocata]
MQIGSSGRMLIVLSLQRGGRRWTGDGRGIVLTGGNQDTTLRMISVLRHPKRLNAQLLIEDQIKGVMKEPGAWKNQIKGLSIVQSSFREVLYLDSDNTPLCDPSHLFDAPIYKTNGRAAFWPDLSKDHPSNAIWRLLVVDKTGNEGMNLAALLIAADMQEDRDFWFHMCNGDKDTFRWAFRILYLPFGDSPRWMSALGFQNAFDGGRFCGHTVLQYDLATPPGFAREPPLFVHSNLLKHLGFAGLRRGNLFTHIKRMYDDRRRLMSATPLNPQLLKILGISRPCARHVP